MNELTQDELRARYLLVCRASHADPDTSPVQNELADELAKLKKIVTHELPELARHRSPHNFTELHQNLMLEMERFHEFCEFPHLAQKVVVGLGGAFSAGKSSLINALLGQKRLATEVDPTTSLPTYLLQGETEAITALNLFKRRVVLSQEEFLSLTHDEKERYGSQVSALLQSAFISLPDFPFKNLALLDTPGYSKPDDKSWSDRTDANLARAQLNSAQYIIWMVSAEAGTISEDDLKFLASLRQDIPRLVVISRADKRAPEDMKKMVELVRTTLEQRALPAVAVLPFSSRKKDAYPVEPIMRQLQSWNITPRELTFKTTFLSQLSLLNKFFSMEKTQAQSQFSRLNFIIAQVGDDDVLEDLAELKAKAKIDVQKANSTIKELENLVADFSKILVRAINRLSTSLPKEQNKQKKKMLDILIRYRKQINKNEPNYNTDFKKLKKAITSSKKHEKWGIQYTNTKKIPLDKRIFTAQLIAESIKSQGYISAHQINELKKLTDFLEIPVPVSDIIASEYPLRINKVKRLLKCFEDENIFAEFTVNLIYLLSLNSELNQNQSFILSEINQILSKTTSRI